MRNIKYIVLHCTATPQDTKIASIERFWKETLGWKNPGYHFIIEADGNVVQLLPIQQIANGVKGHNEHAIHISYIGGQNGQDNRTVQQEAAQIELVEKYKKAFPAAQVLGHRDLSPDLDGDGIIEPQEWTKECPSFDVASWVKKACLFGLLLLLASCSVFKSNKTKTTIDEIQRIDLKSKSVVQKQTKIYGDTIRGIIPLPELIELQDETIEIPVESTGLKLKFNIGKGQLQYQAIATPVAKTDINDNNDVQTNIQSDQSMEHQSSNKKSVWRPPWWVWLVLVFLLVYNFTSLPSPFLFIKNLLNKLLKLFNHEK